jgi:lysophospholipase L1-like esterase
LAYVPTPNYRKGLTVHNSLGYRDREFTVAKPQGVFRIVAMGGSTTYTSAVEDNNLTYPSQLGRILREEYGYESVEVINAGIGGHSSFESLMNLQFRVLDLHPDLIIIYHGTNDVHPRLVPPALYRGDNAAQRKQWRFPDVRLVDRIVFVRILGRLLGGSSQVGISALVDAPTALYMQYFRPYDEASGLEDPMTLLDKNPPVYFRRNLTNIIAVARANGVQVMLATWAHSPLMNDYAATAHYERGFREGNEVVRQVGARFGAPVFEFADVMPPDTVYWRDGRHVNEAGALKKAQLFAAFIHEAGLVVQPSAAPGGPVSN